MGKGLGKDNFNRETTMGESKPEEPLATRLDRIARRSGEDPKAEFRWLMPLCTAEALIGCFHALEGRKAVGIDGRTREEYGENLEENIRNLIERMKRMAYRPGPVREVKIPKEGRPGEYRPLGISNIEDKIVQMWFARTMMAIYEPLFHEFSYGFRPKRGCHDAIKHLHEHLFKTEVMTVIDVDLKKLFWNNQPLQSYSRPQDEDQRRGVYPLCDTNA